MWEKLKNWFTGHILLRRWRNAVFVCGHEDSLWGKVPDYTWDFPPKMAVQGLCASCWVSRSILCCNCSKDIFPGNRVVLYEQQEGLVGNAFGGGETLYIGCIREECCLTPALSSGRWTTRGFVPYYLEGGTIAEETLETGVVVIPKL